MIFFRAWSQWELVCSQGRGKWRIILNTIQNHYPDCRTGKKKLPSLGCVSINLNWHCKAEEPSGRWKNECQQSLLPGQEQEVPGEEWLILTHPLQAPFREGWKIQLLWLTAWYLLWVEGQLLHYILVIRWESEVKMCFPWQQAELARADLYRKD